jgi:hypothetical protein
MNNGSHYNDCDTLQEIFDKISSEYDTEKQLGPISKALLVTHIPKLVIIAQLQKKEEIKP